MSAASGGEPNEGFPNASAADHAGSRSGAPLRREWMWQGHDRTQQASPGYGTQHNYFGVTAAEAAEIAVPIASSAGQRKERSPFRRRDRLLGELLANNENVGVRVVHGMGWYRKTSLSRGGRSCRV